MRAILLIGLLLMSGCPKERTVGFDPATNRCREFDIDAQKFVGPFLPDAECGTEPTPSVIL